MTYSLLTNYVIGQRIAWDIIMPSGYSYTVHLTRKGFISKYAEFIQHNVTWNLYSITQILHIGTCSSIIFYA